MNDKMHPVFGVIIAGSFLVLLAILCAWEPVYDGPPLTPIIQEEHRGVFPKVIATSKRLLAVGEHGRILISYDQGHRWTPALSPTTVNLTNIFFLTENVGWAVGHAGVILKTENGGLSWDCLRKEEAHAPALFDVWFKDTMTGFVIGQDQTLLKTKDGGKTWETLKFKIQAHFYALVVSEDGAIWIIGENRTIYKSQNVGETWQKVNVPFKSSFFAGMAISQHQILTCGLEGRVSFWGPWGMMYSRKICGENLNTILRISDKRFLLLGEKGRAVLVSLHPKRFEVKQLPFLEDVASGVETSDALVLSGAFGIKRITKKDLGLSP